MRGPVVSSTGPSIGSIETNRTAAGVSSRIGIRSSARCWFSAVTPSQRLSHSPSSRLVQ
jgi:hypothetical protein